MRGGAVWSPVPAPAVNGAIARWIGAAAAAAAAVAAAREAGRGRGRDARGVRYNDARSPANRLLRWMASWSAAVDSVGKRRGRWRGQRPCPPLPSPPLPFPSLLGQQHCSRGMSTSAPCLPPSLAPLCLRCRRWCRARRGREGRRHGARLSLGHGPNFHRSTALHRIATWAPREIKADACLLRASALSAVGTYRKCPPCRILCMHTVCALHDECDAAGKRMRGAGVRCGGPAHLLRHGPLHALCSARQ